MGILCSSLQDQKLFKIVDQSCWWSFLCASFVWFLSKFIVQDDYCLFYSSISYAQFTGTRMWCTELHFVTHVSHALVILFTILQMNWPGNRRWCVMGWLHYILWKCGKGKSIKDVLCLCRYLGMSFNNFFTYPIPVMINCCHCRF